MIRIAVHIDDAQALVKVDGLAKTCDPAHISPIVAQAAAAFVRSHLYVQAAHRHSTGHRFNFYADAADSVLPEASGNTASVKISSTGFGLRYFGGRVYPSGRPSAITGKPITKLAIPIADDAEQHTPGDYADLFLLRNRKEGKAYLAGKKSNGMVGLLFALVPMTKHTADKTILPTEEEIANDAVKKVAEALIV